MVGIILLVIELKILVLKVLKAQMKVKLHNSRNNKIIYGIHYIHLTLPIQYLKIMRI